MTHNVYSSDMDSMARGFKHATEIVHMENPDYILAPVVGAVPFIDVFNLVDRKFPLDRVHYLPNSSRFGNRDELMNRWYAHFYQGHKSEEEMKIMCVDEVLSGSSAVKGYKQFQRSLEERARQEVGETASRRDYLDALHELRKHITYTILGIAETGHALNKSFNSLVRRGLVQRVLFENVPTIDDVNLNPVRLKVAGKNGQGRNIYAPEVERFEVTPQYLTFLQNIAQAVGRDPAGVSPLNFSKIQEGLRLSTI